MCPRTQRSSQGPPDGDGKSQGESFCPLTVASTSCPSSQVRNVSASRGVRSTARLRPPLVVPRRPRVHVPHLIVRKRSTFGPPPRSDVLVFRRRRTSTVPGKKGASLPELFQAP